MHRHTHPAGTSLRSRGCRHGLQVVLGLTLLALTGCQEYHWRDDFTGVEEQARDQGKDIFIFYKYWMDNVSNDMLAVELSDPDVKALFQDTINVILDESFPKNSSYMERFDVDSYPAAVIVRPDGRYQTLHGRVSKEEFIEWAKKAKSPEPPEDKGKS